MSRADALILRTAAVWTVFVWGTRIRNILGDHTPGHGFGFKAVHVVLAIISVAFAVAIWAVASRGRKRDRAKAETRS
ncbi:MAG: hypothetical protein M3066_14490 [Actinomycetota bacterium]|nr:hypothetical protein [Actinomycetota bacterium]